MVSGLALCSGVGRAQSAPTLQELMKVVEKQSQQIAEQNRLIQELSARVQAVEAKATDTAVLTQGLSATADDLAAAKDDISTLNKKIEKRLGLSKHIEGLKVTGDLRLRQEFRSRERDLAEPDNADRDRLLARLRLGLLWNSPSEGWELGVGLATGGADGRSTNDAWGEDHAFETGDIRLDYAYASHTWKPGATPLALTFGQQRNPFVVTPLVWDDDLRPVGASLQYGEPLKNDYRGAFATAGAYQLYSGSAMGQPILEENGDVNLFAVQGGYRFTSKPMDSLVALGYRRVTANYDDTSTPADTSSPGLWHRDQTEDFDVVDLLVDNRVSAGPVELRPYGQVAYNLGAGGTKSQQTVVKGHNASSNPEDPADHALAWWLGLDATYGKLKLGYAYAYVGADAVFGPLRDNESGMSTGLTDTDVQGHKLGAAWSFTPNFSLALNAYLLERIEGGSGNVGGNDYDQGSTYQIETLYRF
jgi:predicted porin